MRNNPTGLFNISGAFSIKSGIALALTLGIGQVGFASGGGIVTDDPESLSGMARTETYSPYAERNFPDRPLWG